MLDGGAEPRGADVGRAVESAIGRGEDRIEGREVERAARGAIRLMEARAPRDAVGVERAAEIEQQGDGGRVGHVRTGNLLRLPCSC